MREGQRMPTKIIKLKEFSRELNDYYKKAPKEVKAAVLSGVLKSLPSLVKNSPVDTGQYANSWDVKQDDKSIFIGNFAPHAAIIELGTRPFTPPIGPLLRWAKRVLRDGSQPPDYSDRVWALAKYTQKKISQSGMKPRKIMEKELPKILNNVRSELKKKANSL